MSDRAPEKPRHVVTAAGRWLGDELAPSGFRWLRGSSRLERRASTLVQQIHIQPSRHNRAGLLVKVGTMLNVRDPDLLGWRRQHPDLVVHPANDFVCGHLLGYASGRANGRFYGDATDGDIDLTDPSQRVSRLAAFAAMLREAVLPWFDEASDPDLIVTSRAGDHTNSPVALVEWLASRNRTDLIDPYARRYLARHPWADGAYRAGAAAAGQHLPPPLTGNFAAALGWSATTLTRPG